LQQASKYPIDFGSCCRVLAFKRGREIPRTRNGFGTPNLGILNDPDADALHRSAIQIESIEIAVTHLPLPRTGGIQVDKDCIDRLIAVEIVTPIARHAGDSYMRQAQILCELSPGRKP
jgi:hypothetical protein